MNMRQTALGWIVKTSKAVHAPMVGNFPSKKTVTSEKLHSPEVFHHGRK